MFRVKGFFTTLTLNPQRYTKTLDGIMDVQLRQAARLWLRAVILKVPVWTGTSMGSLKPLGAFLRVAIPISPVAKRSGMGPEVGASKSTFTFGKQGTKYIFEFNEGVLHYTINEFFNVSPPIHLKTPGPYDSFKAGNEAFQAYIANELPKRLPRIEEVLTTQRVEIT